MPRPIISILVFTGVVLALLAGVVWYVIYVQAPQQEEEHTARCAARNLSPARHTESSGKTSVTARFCVDREDRVYWIPE